MLIIMISVRYCCRWGKLFLLRVYDQHILYLDSNRVERYKFLTAHPVSIYATKPLWSDPARVKERLKKTGI